MALSKEADAGMFADDREGGLLDNVELGDGEVSSWQKQVDDAEKVSKLLCVICGKHPIIKKHSFCREECQKDCKAARRQAKDQGNERETTDMREVKR